MMIRRQMVGFGQLLFSHIAQDKAVANTKWCRLCGSSLIHTPTAYKLGLSARDIVTLDKLLTQS